MFSASGVTEEQSSCAADAPTEMVVCPTTVPIAAEIVAMPAETPVTTPAEFTVAMSGFDVLHVNVCPLTAFREASNAAALSASVPSMNTEVVVEVVTVTLATVPPPLGPVDLPPEHAQQKASRASTAIERQFLM
jgi:hypothetical protein